MIMLQKRWGFMRSSRISRGGLELCNGEGKQWVIVHGVNSKFTLELCNGISGIGVGRKMDAN